MHRVGNKPVSWNKPQIEEKIRAEFSVKNDTYCNCDIRYPRRADPKQINRTMKWNLTLNQERE